VTSVALQVIIGAAAGLAVFWVVPTVWALVVACDAPRRQRDEARERVRLLEARIQITGALSTADQVELLWRPPLDREFDVAEQATWLRGWLENVAQIVEPHSPESARGLRELREREIADLNTWHPVLGAAKTFLNQVLYDEPL
jgi:hypothetical protein